MYVNNDISGLRRLRTGPDKLVKEYDSVFNDYLDRIHNTLGGKDGYGYLSTLAEKLRHIKKEAQKKYLDDLMYPEKAINAKIPSTVPFPTASFKMHNTTTITTNSLGNFAIVWNPFALGNSMASQFYVNTAATLNGAAADNNFGLWSVGFNNIPLIYAEYRLVSASIIITCKSS